MSAVYTTCPYCGVGCGVRATPGPDGVEIAGDKNHPANYGRLCSKGSALGDTISLEGRILAPRIQGDTADWDSAIALIADKFSAAIAEHGPDSVAFYVSGQLLTEDYYIANKLIKGYFGTANIDTNSRLCMASSVAGHKRAFGTDTVPGTYEDLETADLIVLTGSNLAWCHPVLFQRIVAAKAARPEMMVVNIDPRATATNDLADLHLPLAPGSDVALFNGLLSYLDAQGKCDPAYTADHVNGLEAAIAAAREDSPAEITGLSPLLLEKFYALWAGHEKVVTIYSQGVNQSSAGADKVNSILNCHLATGRIGREGMGPFSVTGQPNAMGGREVGGLANMLACHLDVENETHRDAVQDFWQSPVMAPKPGLKAVDLFQAVEAGKIKALWVMSTNPAVSMPEADRVKSAIENCDFVVVSDILERTDTADLAHVVLPAAAWGEKSGTVTNSDRTISRQRPFLPMPGDVRADWKILCDVAIKMGYSGFEFETAADVFREYAAMSEISGKLGKDFDISALADITDAEFDALKPTRWPITKARQGGRFFAEGGFFTPDGKGRMLPIRYRAPKSTPSEKLPLRLNTGRIRDQWHTMTRTARANRLNQHIAEPFLEIHPKDAAKYNITPASLVTVTNEHGSAILRANITERVAPGCVFAPMHWTAQYASAGRVDALVAANPDPVSGQPELKACPVAIAPFKASWYGFALSRMEPKPNAPYWAKAPMSGGWRMEIADMQTPADWEETAKALFDLGAVECVMVEDRARMGVRLAFIEQGQVRAALFVSNKPVEVARSFVANCFAENGDLKDLLPGRPGADQPDPGATICSCYDVGINTILQAILEQDLPSVAAIGDALRAGTNCGSCRPELQGLLDQAKPRIAAE